MNSVDREAISRRKLIVELLTRSGILAITQPYRRQRPAPF